MDKPLVRRKSVHMPKVSGDAGQKPRVVKEEYFKIADDNTLYSIYGEETLPIKTDFSTVMEILKGIATTPNISKVANFQSRTEYNKNYKSRVYDAKQQPRQAPQQAPQPRQAPQQPKISAPKYRSQIPLPKVTVREKSATIPEPRPESLAQERDYSVKPRRSPFSYTSLPVKKPLEPPGDRIVLPTESTLIKPVGVKMEALRLPAASKGKEVKAKSKAQEVLDRIDPDLLTMERSGKNKKNYSLEQIKGFARELNIVTSGKKKADLISDIKDKRKNMEMS